MKKVIIIINSGSGWDTHFCFPLVVPKNTAVWNFNPALEMLKSGQAASEAVETPLEFLIMNGICEKQERFFFVKVQQKKRKSLLWSQN